MHKVLQLICAHGSLWTRKLFIAVNFFYYIKNMNFCDNI